MRKHEELLRQIHTLIIGSVPAIEHIERVNPAAENASEVEFLADDGQWYILSIIERDT